MKSLLQQRDEAMARRREAMRTRSLQSLRDCLEVLLPGTPVWVFGSVLQRGAFRENSDIDIALECEPASISIYRLQALLSERLLRKVDILLLNESRFAESIRREGQKWMPSN